MPESGLMTREVKAYLSKAEAAFKKFEEDWFSFAWNSEMDAKKEMVTIVTEDISSNLTARGITYKVDVNVNDKERKFFEYITMCLQRREFTMLNFFTECDEKLRRFQDAGVAALMLQNFVGLMGRWIDFCQSQQFRLSDDITVKPVINSKCIDIYNKWRTVVDGYGKLEEAKEYGVDVENIETHRAYLEAKEKMNAATNSRMMRRVIRDFAALDGYLDSEELIAYCNSKAEEFALKQLNDRKIQKEKLREKVAEYEKKLSEVSKARDEFIAEKTAGITAKYDRKIAEIESDYQQAISENEKSTANAQEKKAQLTKELEAASALAVFKKMSLRSALLDLEETISTLKAEKKKIVSDYKKAQKSAKSTYDSSIARMNKTADEQYKLPKDPRST